MICYLGPNEKTPSRSGTLGVLMVLVTEITKSIGSQRDHLQSVTESPFILFYRTKHYKNV